MLVTEFQCQNAVAKVVPVDDDLAPAQPSDEPYKRKRRYARWVLSFDANVEIPDYSGLTRL